MEPAAFTLPSMVPVPSGEEPVLPPVHFPRDDDFKGIIPRAAEREHDRISVEGFPPRRLKPSTSGRRATASTTRSASSDILLPHDLDKRGSAHTLKADKRRSCCCRCLCLQNLYDKATPVCRAVNKNNKFQFVMFLALAFALFLPDVWILANRPNNNNLDIILTLVWVAFLGELVIQLIGSTRAYFNSFFFWTDILGACSLLLDLSYVTSSLLDLNSTQVSQNTVVMRAARVAKLGTRAGRFTKLVKLLRFLPGMRELVGGDQGTAKVISARLNFALSMRVSCLIIVLVMVLPLFSMWTYPEQDWSMRSFMDVLDRAAQAGAHARFAWQLEELGAFYRDKAYFPYSLVARSPESLSPEVLALLPWEASRGPPLRASNRFVFVSNHLQCEFNFEHPNKIDSMLGIILLLIVMLLMVGFSVILSSSVSAIVLRPLERLLQQVRHMAATIFQSVHEMSDGDDQSREEQEENLQDDSVNVLGTEVDLLERVVQKLGAISNIRVHRDHGERDNLAGLGDFDRAVINGFQGGSIIGSLVGHQPGGIQQQKILEDESALSDDGGAPVLGDLSAQQAMVTDTGLSLELLDSWNFNPLELDTARNRAAMVYFVGPHNHGSAYANEAMTHFLQTAEGSYIKNNPFHNWFHAIDATHGVYRLMQIFKVEHYLSNLERFALLVSAVCHDAGHPGLNNSFLIESSHELAQRYNDKSPLENLHCATLFEIVNMPKCNIFASLSKAQYQEVRKVCIEAILHTDNAQHFAMIKEVQMIYEVNSEILDIGRECFFADPNEFPTKEAGECYNQHDSRKLLLKLLLHLADISNSTKPFRICRIWAWQVLEEFFLQGDKERRMGVPVQALNHRDNVNRAFSQIGFIEFLVSPLIFAVVKVLPPLAPQLGQMINNLKTWHSQWLESSPVPTEAEKKQLEGRIAKLEQKYRDCL